MWALVALIGVDGPLDLQVTFLRVSEVSSSGALQLLHIFMIIAYTRLVLSSSRSFLFFSSHVYSIKKSLFLT